MQKIKTWFIPYFIIIFIFLSSHIVAAIKSDTTIVDSDKKGFTAIDLYSGRLINGIGFGFNQYVEEQIDGRQEIESRSNLFFNLAKDISVSIANQTSIRKINPTGEISFSSAPVNSNTQFNAQIRPFTGFQLIPNIEVGTSKLIYNSHLVDILSIRQNTSIVNYGLAGMFMSSKGLIHPSTTALKWLFYVNENIPFISAQQTLISFKFDRYESDYNGVSEKLDRSLKEDDENFIIKRRFETDWHEYSITSQLNYGISEKMRSGYCLKFTSFTSALWDDYLNLENYANQNNREISVEPRLSLMLSNDFYQQLNITYKNFIENSAYQAFTNKKNKWKKSFCDFDYQFHWLHRANYPTLEKVLANYNQVFGNRLNKGSFHLQLNVNRSSDFIKNKYFKIFENNNLLELFHPNLQSKLVRFQVQANYGLSNYLQIGLSSTAIQKKSFKPPPGSAESKWYNRETLKNTLTIDWATYTFSEHWKQFYGWDYLSAIDQYEKPLLQPRMFKGKIECSFYTLSKTDKFYGNINIFNSINNSNEFPFYDNKRADLKSELTIGLWGAFELHYAGQHFFYSSKDRNYLDKDWQMDFCLRWQPFKKLKIELLQNSARYVNNWDSRFSYYLDPFINVYDVDYEFYNKTIHTWNLRIVSLF